MDPSRSSSSFPLAASRCKPPRASLRAGARALGVGSDLVNLAAIDAGTPEVITETARAYLDIVAKFRKG
jgi:hypothetical protein